MKARKTASQGESKTTWRKKANCLRLNIMSFSFLITLALGRDLGMVVYVGLVLGEIKTCLSLSFHPSTTRAKMGSSIYVRLFTARSYLIGWIRGTWRSTNLPSDGLSSHIGDPYLGSFSLVCRSALEGGRQRVYVLRVYLCVPQYLLRPVEKLPLHFHPSLNT